jgi:hypothetical protein
MPAYSAAHQHDPVMYDHGEVLGIRPVDDQEGCC